VPADKAALRHLTRHENLALVSSAIRSMLSGFSPFAHSMTTKRRVVVTGLGFITSIGNNQSEVLASLRSQRTGIEIHPELDQPKSPVKLAGTIKGFSFPGEDPDGWTFPKRIELSHKQLRSMAPHVVYAYAAMHEALADAALTPEMVSDPRTGLLCASAGSPRLMFHHLQKMLEAGPLKCHPFALPASIAGTLNFNLVALFQIRGPCVCFVSACSSSAHAFGYGLDLIRQDRQDTILVVGAEDGDAFTLLPFASVRALTRSTDPKTSPCAFDVKRDGFAGTGGAAVVILEELEHARERNAPIYAEALGWGQSSDGYNIMAPEPNGEGLGRAIRDALANARVAPEEIDYINAHATATPLGDVAEIRAIQNIFTNGSPWISSTKSQTGHGLSMAGALEAGICSLAIRERFTPVSMNITELDPECAASRIVTDPVDHAPKTVLKNSSAFGGANVALVLRRFE
jgi:3-oxoacyl-[acyl-carrier-protein] synthase-1